MVSIATCRLILRVAAIQSNSTHRRGTVQVLASNQANSFEMTWRSLENNRS